MTSHSPGSNAAATSETTSSRIVRTLRHALAYGIGYSASTVTGFLLVPLYLQVLSRSEFGILALLTVTVTVASEVFSLGVSSALFRSYFDYEHEEGRRNVVTTAFVIVAAAALVLLVGGVATAGRTSDLLFDTERYANHLRLVSVIASLRLVRSIPFSTYRARQRSKEWAVANVSFSAVKLTLTVLFLLALDMGIIGILVADLIAETMLCLYLFSRSFTDLTGRFRRAEAQRLLAYGLPLGVMGLVTLAMSAADKYMLQAFGGAEDVGVYDLGQKFALLIMFFLITPFKLVWQPMSLELLGKSGAKEYYSASLTGFLYLMSVAVVALSIFAGDVLHAVAPAPYQSARSVVLPLALVAVIQGLLVFASFGLSVARRTDVLAAVNAAGAFVNVGLNLILIPRWGIRGAAAAAFCGWAAILFLDAKLSSRHVAIHIAWSRVGVVVVSIAGVLLAGSALDAAAIPLWLSLVAKASLTAVFTVLAARVLFGRERSRRLLHVAELLKGRTVPIPAADVQG